MHRYNLRIHNGENKIARMRMLVRLTGVVLLELSNGNRHIVMLLIADYYSASRYACLLAVDGGPLPHY